MNDEDIEKLLPWYVNDTLSNVEREAVESLLERSQHARDQLEFLQRLSDQVKNEPVAAVSELGWRRLQRQIQSETPTRTKSWWKPALAVAATVIMTLQIGILVRQPNTAIHMQPLGQQTVTSTIEGTYWRVQIEFRDESSWQEINHLINQLQGTIVEGPSSIGLLRIAVPMDNGKYTTPEALLAGLREQSQVIHVAIESQ